MALVAHIAARSTNATTVDTASAGAIDTTGATFLAVAVSDADGTATLTDSFGNIYESTEVQDSDDFGAGVGGGVRLCYCSTPVVGPGHTWQSIGVGPALAAMAATQRIL